jgi:hypothetical protein
MDVKALCSVLVAVAGEAAKTLTEKRLANQKETSVASSVQDQGHVNNKAEKSGLVDSNADGSKGRSLSPETLALMCDERDTMLMVAASPNCSVEPTSQLPNGQDQVYAEQEKVVLTKFRDCLNRIISCGEVKESNCSMSRMDLDTPVQTTVRIDPVVQQAPVANGVSQTAKQPSQLNTTTPNTSSQTANGVSQTAKQPSQLTTTTTTPNTSSQTHLHKTPALSEKKDL